jgi:hypothetical protein
MASREEVKEVERPSHQRERMLIVFFDRIGVFFMNCLLEGQKMNSTYSAPGIFARRHEEMYLQ